MGPIAYTIANRESPKANEMPAKPILSPAKTALPQPPKTSTKVPINSAIYRFMEPLMIKTAIDIPRGESP
jgi:hypothetical protein